MAGFLARRREGQDQFAAELPTGGDQFLEVLAPRDALFATLPPVVGHQSAGLGAAQGDLVERTVLDAGRHVVDEFQERADRGGGAAGEEPPCDAFLGGLPHGHFVGARDVANHLDGLGTDAARRRVHDAFEGDVGMALAHQAHVGQGVADFGALEEA